MPNLTKPGDNMRSLASLAFLESQHDVEGKKQDSLGMLMPLVLETLQGCAGISFTVQQFSDKLKVVTGLELPDTVVSALLSRCKGSKRNPRYLKLENGRYERTDVPIECSNYVGQRNAINERHKMLLAAIVECASSQGLGELTTEDAGLVLADYLDRNFRSLSVGEIVPDEELVPCDYRWLEKFILRLHDTGDAMFDTVVTLVRGRVMFDAAFMPGFGAEVQRLKNMVVYLDSPVICRYMGFGTESDGRLAVEAVRILKEAGAVCRVFEETAAEVGRIMGRVATNWGHPKDDEGPESFLFTMPARGRSRSEAQRIADSPVESIESAGFKVVPAPPREKKTVTDEEKLASRLSSKGRGYPDYNRVRHDVNCIAAVVTQRGFSSAMALGNARFLFVSDSPRTIQNVRRWWTKDEGRVDIPPIFSIVDLANIAWLYGGIDNDGSFSKEALMTTCAASMMPSDKVWAAFSAKLRSFVSEEKMTPEVVANYLFNGCVKASLSDIPDSAIEGGLTDAQLEEILAEGDREIAERVNGAELRESKDALEDVNRRLAAVEQANRDKDDLIAELSRRIKDADDKNEQNREAMERDIRKRADREATAIIWACLFLCFAAAVAVIAIFLVMDLPDKVLSLLSGVPLALLGFLSKILNLQDRLAARITRRKMTAIIPDGADEARR